MRKTECRAVDQGPTGRQGMSSRVSYSGQSLMGPSLLRKNLFCPELTGENGCGYPDQSGQAGGQRSTGLEPEKGTLGIAASGQPTYEAFRRERMRL